MTNDTGTDRRRFLGLFATASAATIGAAGPAAAQPSTAAPAKGASSAPPEPSELAEFSPPSDVPKVEAAHPGSDFMVDVLKSLNIKYVAANPASTFRALQESVINYGGNRSPEFLTCCHEEISVGMAHGYYKVEGELMATMMHGTVGVQHASMAIYNAFGDRVPVLILSGNALNAATRRNQVEWWHSVQDNAATVRDFTKWDDMPVSLQHFAESQVRAIQIATAVPRGPVMVTVDTDLQENPVSKESRQNLSIPKLTRSRPPQGDDGALRELAKLLAAAERPVIYADRYAQTPTAMARLVELADLVQAPVIDSGARANFPNTHPLNQLGRTDAIRQADLVLALESVDLWGVLNRMLDVTHRPSHPVAAAGVKIVRLGTSGAPIRSNYQEFQRYVAADLEIAADAEASIPPLIGHLKQLIDRPLATKLTARRRSLEEAYATRRQADLDSAAVSWDLNPVSPARTAMEVWDQVKNEDWALVGLMSHPAAWAQRLWPMDKYYHHTGSTGAGGLGYGISSAVGAALAHRDKGRLAINFQPDGDFMYVPSALWTAAHHGIPMLTVMFNNRAYHQETMHLQRMANRMDRNIDNAHIGTTLTNPNIDYAKIAQGMGIYGSGPISDPAELRNEIRRALAVVKRGEPALIDVVSQPR